MPLPSILKNRRNYVSITKLKNKPKKLGNRRQAGQQAAGRRQQAASRAGGPAGGKLHLTSMGFYGTTNYDSGLPTMPRQTILENTRATRPWHIGAHETLSRLGVLPPYPKKKNTKRKGQQSGVVFFQSKS